MNTGKKTISNLLSVHCSWPNLFVFSLGKLLFSLKDHMEMIKYFLNKQHLAARLSVEIQGRIHLPQSSGHLLKTLITKGRGLLTYKTTADRQMKRKQV